MGTSIYVIGSSNTDMVVKATRLPRPGETILGGEFLMTPGGKGANQAVAAARLGGNVTLVAKVGNDIFGTEAINQFVREKINTDFIEIDPHHPSGVALINVDENGENCIAVASGANAHLEISTANKALDAITGSAIILLQHEIPMATIAHVVKKAATKNLTIILNPAPAALLSSDVMKDIFLITPNESEAELLTGIIVSDVFSATNAANFLHDRGVKNVIITLGARGAFFSSQTKKILVEAPSVMATDTTAAGDCFNGALAVGISEGMAIEEAIRFACNAASISVTRLGAQASMPYRKEIKD